MLSIAAVAIVCSITRLPSAVWTKRAAVLPSSFVSRGHLSALIGQIGHCVIGMSACSVAHCWGASIFGLVTPRS